MLIGHILDSIFPASEKTAAFFLAAVLSLASQAQVLTRPTGPVVLTVSGKIAHKNSEAFAEFDAAMLDAMPVSQISTSTPWRKGGVTFSGPSLKALLTAVGASGQTLRMIALDDYAVRVPIGDATLFTPVLARKIDGIALKIKDRGPLFMIYLFDDRPELKNDLYYGRSIWHLSRIVVE